MVGGSCTGLGHVLSPTLESARSAPTFFTILYSLKPLHGRVRDAARYRL